ncbi:MAG TPA: YetF domain-containing protein [Tepidisphaeraceae bacterium]|jgi:uncharacterized membrane protein YcaP (DUF421 family)|nr:YetF domain-containing protein [Tepidisphaeraceae bacterium]
MFALLADDPGTMWTRMFLFDPTVSVLEKMLRPILVYVFLLVGLRLAGKRELAQLNAFDLIVLLTLSNTVQNAIIGNDNSVSGGVIGATTLLAVNYLVVRIAHKYKRFDALIEGRAEILMRGGKIVREHLDHELITHAQLVAAAHKQGIASLHDVDKCILEPTGTITFVQKSPTPDGTRHSEIMTLLNSMTDEIKTLRAAASARSDQIRKMENDETRSTSN